MGSKMKKWEENKKLQNHLSKLKTAKPAVNTNIPKSAKSSRSSKHSSISLYPLLKQFNLQQYHRKLKELGYESKPYLIPELSKKGFQELMSHLKVLPGHQSRFESLCELLSQISTAESTRALTCHQTCSEISSGSPINRRTSSIQNSSTNRYSLRIPNFEKQKLEEELEKAKKHIQELEEEIQRKQTQPIKLDRKLPVEISRDSFFKSPPVIEECKNPSPPIETAKSLDSWTLKSNISNLDTEEICRCIGRVIMQHAFTSGKPGLPSSLKDRLVRVFLHSSEQITENGVYNLIKNMVVRGQLEPEVPIMAMAYLERFVAKTGLELAENNWKRLIFVCTMEASKIWDDESFENNSFAMAFSNYNIQEINSMESAFLTLLDFELIVSGSDYAKIYFTLRTYATKKDQSFPLKALDVNTVLRLQHQSSKAQEDAVKSEQLHKSM